MKPKIIAIIPARGGSKGLPRKNIKLLNDRPLIAYTICAVSGSTYVDKVVVSTEDNEIAEVSKSYGVEVIRRPEQLARDESSSIDVVMHVVDWFEQKKEHYDAVVLLEPTSPLRKESDIDSALDLLIKNLHRADSLVGVGEVHCDTEHPYGIKEIDDGYVRPFIKNSRAFHRRQELPRVYSIFGGIYISTVDALRKYKSFYQERTIPYLVDRWQQYEIDDIYDFLCVEAVMKHRLEKSDEVVKVP